MTVKEVREYATKHYTEGYDAIVECWTDQDIQEFIDEGGDVMKRLEYIAGVQRECYAAAKYFAGVGDDDDIITYEIYAEAYDGNNSMLGYDCSFGEFDDLEDAKKWYYGILNESVKTPDKYIDTDNKEVYYWNIRVERRVNGEFFDLVSDLSFNIIRNGEEFQVDDYPVEYGNPYTADDCEYEDYSPSNPWDAPGMKISDFI